MKKRKILVVEDDDRTAYPMTKILLMWGYEVCGPVSSGNESILAAELENPDMVLMDIKLKGSMNGIEAASAIATKFGIPIIFITGYAQTEIRKRALSVNPVDYFLKPVDYYMLKKRLQSFFESAIQRPPI